MEGAFHRPLHSGESPSPEPMDAPRQPAQRSHHPRIGRVDRPGGRPDPHPRRRHDDDQCQPSARPRWPGGCVLRQRQGDRARAGGEVSQWLGGLPGGPPRKLPVRGYRYEPTRTPQHRPGVCDRRHPRWPPLLRDATDPRADARRGDQRLPRPPPCPRGRRRPLGQLPRAPRPIRPCVQGDRLRP